MGKLIAFAFLLLLLGCGAPAGGQPAKWQICGATKPCVEVTPGPAKANHKVAGVN